MRFRFAFFSLGFVAFTVKTFAQPPASSDPASARITIELQCVTLPQAEAVPIIGKFRSQSATDHTVAFADVAKLIEKGAAKLVGWPILHSQLGQRGTTEQIEEVRFPIEFSSGTASIYLTDNDGTITKQPSRIRGTDIQPMGQNFQTYSVGVTFEAEPTVRETTTIEVAFKASHVLLKSIDHWTIEHEYTTEKKTEKIIQEQPRFIRYQVENLVQLGSGEHAIIGVFKTADVEPTLELFILGAEVEEPPRK